MKRTNKVLQCLILLFAVNCPRWTFAQYNIKGTMNGDDATAISATIRIRGSSNGITIYPKNVQPGKLRFRILQPNSNGCVSKNQSSNLNL